MQKITLKYIVNLFAAAVLCGCGSTLAFEGDLVVAREFYARPTAEQLRTFKEYKISDQFDIFVFGNQVRHPPAIYLARCFALNGYLAVDLLRKKLKVASDDLMVRDIAMLLATVSSMRKYPVASDMELMSLLKSRVAKMGNIEWKETADQLATSIGNERVETSSQAHECE